MKLLITLYIMGGLLSSIVCINYVLHKMKANSDLCRSCSRLTRLHANGKYECSIRSYDYWKPPQICSMYKPKEDYCEPSEECKGSCKDCMYCSNVYEIGSAFTAYCSCLRYEIHNSSICSNFTYRESPNPSSLKVKTISAEYPIPASLMNSHDLLKSHLAERLVVDILQYVKVETVHDPRAGDTLRVMIKVVDPNE